jgi:hypothetical protein
LKTELPTGVVSKVKVISNVVVTNTCSAEKATEPKDTVAECSAFDFLEEEKEY